MSSRQQEKERRRAERLAKEQEAARAVARTKRLQIAGGAVLAIAAIAVLVVVLTSGSSSSADGPKSTADAKANIPAAGANANADGLPAAAKAAQCTVLNPPSEGRTHVTTTVTYKNSNPPASGPHNPTPAQDGIYDPGNEPAKENWVHSLEHGRIVIQYRPGTPKATIDGLETVGSEALNGTPAYHVLGMQNNTRMPYAVAAVAWTHVLGCNTMNPQVYDAIRAFRARYTDKGPELIP
ncbi:MAG: hypothetical protein QOH43_4545 [Solirubrobacteraceae bacterium]|nr:hypothetical protein [Solirubrobacteraceae bacterium]